MREQIVVIFDTNMQPNVKFIHTSIPTYRNRYLTQGPIKTGISSM